MALSLRDLTKKEFPAQPYWVSEGILSLGSLMVIGGAPKSYKSFLLNTIITDCVLGGALFGAYSEKHGRRQGRFIAKGGAKILMLEQEVGEFDLKERFKNYISLVPEHQRDALLDSIYIESCNHELQLDTPQGVSKIEHIVNEIKPNILVFDPIVEFHSGDENDAQQTMRTLKAINMLREKYKTTVILAHHTKKPTEGADNDSPDRLRGSSALYGKGDTFFMLRVINENSCVLRIKTKMRRGKTIAPFLIKLNRKTLKFEWHGWASTEKEGAARKETADPDEI